MGGGLRPSKRYVGRGGMEVLLLSTVLAYVLRCLFFVEF